MTRPIHDAEADTTELTVRALLEEQCPEWSALPLTSLDTSGTTNALWRVTTERDEPDVVVRLPRLASGVGSVEKEVALLPALAATPVAAVVGLPTVAHAGTPAAGFPYPWAVFEWIDGTDAWSARAASATSECEFAADLAASIRIIRGLDGLPAPDRKPGERGGPLGALLGSLDRWLTEPSLAADQLLNVPAIRRVADQCAEVVGSTVAPCFLHGDLIPGNLLTTNERLTAIIDWGGAGYGDPAQDLSPAWALFEGPAREVFRDELEVDDEMWLRARANELEHAIGGVLYYGPKGHLLGEIMTQTLDRILAD